jgi:hypothetical protein
MLKTIWTLAAVAVLSACGGSPGDRVLATVNGSRITQAELEQAVKRATGADLQHVDPALQRNILETMVLSRLIARQAERKLGDDKRRELEIQASMHRDDLYVRAYLQEFAPPQPLTAEMIRGYYEKHPEQFGGGRVQQYEMLAGVTNNDESKRQRLMQAFAKAAQVKDWRRHAGQLLQQGLPLRYSRGESRDRVLHERLKQAMASLQKGETSPVVLVDGDPYLIRVTEVQNAEPRPLAEVSSDIRRMLVPQQLKEALDKVSGELMKSADIKYTEKE